MIRVIYGLSRSRINNTVLLTNLQDPILKLDTLGTITSSRYEKCPTGLELFEDIVNAYWQISGKFLRPFYWKIHPSKNHKYLFSFKKWVVS